MYWYKFDIYFACHKKVIIEFVTKYNYNVVVSPEDISIIKKTTSTNQTDVMEEDATTGMINIWKNLGNNVFKWKICIYKDVKNGTE